jgi:hypothetical protein
VTATDEVEMVDRLRAVDEVLGVGHRVSRQKEKT